MSKEGGTVATTALISAALVGAAAGTVAAMTAFGGSSSSKKQRDAAAESKDTYEAKTKPETGEKIDDIDIKDVYLWNIEHLGHRFAPEMSEDSENKMVSLTNSIQIAKSETETTFYRQGSMDKRNAASLYDSMGETSYNKIISSDIILGDLVRKPDSPKETTHTKAFVRAGPRKVLHFNPKKVNAAIVTCGGLCPGLNNVVREITNTLYELYGIEGTVYGIRGGYKGFYDKDLQPIKLTPALVENIHHEGGTVLCSSRGGFDEEKILKFITSKKIKQLYVIGGDGTHRGAFRIHEACMEKGINVAVAGIPKTIDNDVNYIDRSFGFASSVEEAQNAIRSAKVEASCNLPNGIGIVKLMGRSAGFIAVHSTMASGDVDLCLVPEVPIVLEGENGCLPHLFRRVKNQGYAVVVVAEGAGEELLGTNTETDASGNKILPKIGEFMKDEINKYFKKQGETATVKYIDPSYMIRSIPANASDSLYCMQLGQNVVHGAMAGYTGFTVGLCNDRMVYLPIPEVVATSPRTMRKNGRTWERVLAVTRQPNTV